MASAEHPSCASMTSQPASQPANQPTSQPANQQKNNKRNNKLVTMTSFGRHCLFINLVLTPFHSIQIQTSNEYRIRNHLSTETNKKNSKSSCHYKLKPSTNTKSTKPNKRPNSFFFLSYNQLHSYHTLLLLLFFLEFFGFLFFLFLWRSIFLSFLWLFGFCVYLFGCAWWLIERATLTRWVVKVDISLNW